MADRSQAPVSWCVALAVRSSGPGGRVVETDLGDHAVEVGPHACVGDLVVAMAALGASEGALDDVGWAGLCLSDGSVAGADERLRLLPVARGDRLVVVVSATADPDPSALAFGAPRPPALRYRLVPLVARDEGDTGEVLLHPGVVAIGRSAEGNAVVIDDPSVSRHHASLRVDERVVVSDLGSTNGTFVDGVAVGAGHRLPIGARLGLGDVEFELQVTPSSESLAGRHESAPTPDPVDGTIAVRRSPVVHARPRPVVITLPDALPAAEEHRVPWFSIAVPVGLAAVMVTLPLVIGGTGGTYLLLSAGFLLMSPVMVAAAYWEAKRSARARRRARADRFDAAFADAELQGRTALTREADVRRSEAPGVDVRRRQAHRSDVGLWSGADRFDGELRLGTTRVASLLRFETVSGGPFRVNVACPVEVDADAHARLRRLAVELGHHEVAPLSMASSGVVAVVGDAAWCAGIARWLVLQAVTVLPPSRLSVSVVSPELGEWDWLKWLPHLTEGDAAPAGVRRLVVVESGAASMPTAPDRVGSDELVIWLVRHRADAPAGCTTLLEATDDGSGVARVTDTGTGDEVSPVTVDRVEAVEAETWARDLAPLVESDDEGAAGAVPGQVSMAALYGGLAGALDDADLMIEAWERSTGSLDAPIGRSGSGAVSVDLRRDGPHAVVAGTTGSGKSELLQTLVASLAALHPPSRVTFLLIDYKGGAAFAECGELPHTVGLVTDLDDALVRRVLVSLRAELRRREHLLAAAGAKDLATMEERDPAGAPPSLVIVVDEFASLTVEVPGFVEDMVDIARRGRSLGLHLVLATQRPAGVVNDHLLANANLRIALRLADGHESSDLVGVPDAAAIPPSLPGRAVARLGPGDVVDLQTAYCGGHSPTPDDRRDRCRDVSIRPFALAGDGLAAGWDASSRAPSAATDLQRLVATAVEAARRTGLPSPHRPWLDQLPEGVTLGDVHHAHAPGAGGAAPGRSAAEQVMVPLGLVDDPEHQTQFVRWHDLAAGHVVVCGVGAGPVGMVEAIVVAAAVGRSPDDLRIDVIDGERGVFGPLGALPHVGSVVDPTDGDRVMRLLRDLRSAVGARRPMSGRRVVVVHDLVGLIGLYDGVDGGAVVDAIVRIAIDGAASGVHLVAVADRRIGVPSPVANASGVRVVMALGSDDDLAALGVDRALVTGPTGRSVVDGLAMQAVALDRVGRWSLGAVVASEHARLGGRRAPAVGALPERVESAALLSGAAVGDGGGTWGSLLVGVGDVDLAPARMDLDGGNLLVAGPLRSGRSTALATMAASLVADPRRQGRVRPILVAPRATAWSQAPIWHDVAIGGAALRLLQAERAAIAAGRPQPGTVIFVDDSTDLDDVVDEELALLAALSRHGAVRIVAAAESALARRAYGGVVAQLRRERRALLLQPDVDLDGDLAGVRLARRSRSPMPPGRGELVEHGHASLVQVALASHLLGGLP